MGAQLGGDGRRDQGIRSVDQETHGYEQQDVGSHGDVPTDRQVYV